MSLRVGLSAWSGNRTVRELMLSNSGPRAAKELQMNSASERVTRPIGYDGGGCDGTIPPTIECPWEPAVFAPS
jgi:hypothetical protein